MLPVVFPWKVAWHVTMYLAGTESYLPSGIINKCNIVMFCSANMFGFVVVVVEICFASNNVKFIGKTM